MASPSKVTWVDRGWQPVAIGFCPSEQAWHREMKRLNSSAPWPDVPNAGGHTQWLENDATGEAVIIVVVHADAQRDALEVIMTIVHEAVHVWQFLCQHIGEKSPGIEMEAYGIENIARGLIEAYCKTQGKGKVWA
ncbi:hypothetical protein SAMN02982989_3410 [Xaviernesmea oryzae]|uniref:SprT-like domain-containing protein n=1 Tax=Xaviernesmea oryzae TaxID=464029 RepID=A0A1X7G8F3_9HYPH|nr:hypothetical protein [Xaviernesmea oryzae]SMF65825.1 hypothetical protein SAMN02982989_3410 [Xaviernesmea oryzae]